MDSAMFRPPVNRAMRVLDRSFFHRDAIVSAARVLDLKNLARLRTEMLKSKDMLAVRQVLPIRPDPTPDSTRKCILLRPGIVCEDTSTWSDTVTNLVKVGDIDMISFKLELDYDLWTAHDIISSVLPTALLENIPTAFSLAGHVAQLNLREPYLPYKQLIGEVILDKNPGVRTVINKRETLGAENEYRVLEYEVIAGEDDMQVEAKESDCTFQFDFSKVFWNSRLNTEHRRLVDTYFQQGEAVCDVMAGVGPFAIPAAKKGVFVWANDLNPDCFTSLQQNVKLNKVSQFVRPFREDGHTFIPSAATRLFSEVQVAKVPLKISRTAVRVSEPKSTERFTEVTQPKVFSHYVMNLPSTAIDFLPDFCGLYHRHQHEFEPFTRTKLPMIHCYCFGPKTEDDDQGDEAAKTQICQLISDKLQYTITSSTPELDVFDVRDVSPHKRQYCVSFRLPPDVAFLLPK